ncbi:MAG TPA: VIT domain-containing protein, partial [Cytophagaceae bacterium]
LGFNSSSQLEIEHNFDLPKEAIVTDSWLWVGDSIIQAKILDQWTASQIYEGIVNRRKDPSILTKGGEGNYKLKIYPLLPNEIRKVKITYLVPLKWASQAAYSQIPTNIFNGLSSKPQVFQVLVFPSKDLKNPRILENSTFTATKLNDPSGGIYEQIDIPIENLNNTLSLAFDSPMKNGIYLSRYEVNDKGYFQMAMIPSLALNLGINKKVALLLDYTEGKTSITLQQLKEIVKAKVKANFLPTDSINILYNNKLDVVKAKEGWIKADSAGIEIAFSSFNSKPLNKYSDLVGLLKTGIDFVKGNGNNGSIVLLSASEGFSNQAQANDLINGLTSRMNPIFPIHIVDFVDQNYSSNYVNGTYYYGNEYLNSSLSRLTIGSYFNVRTQANFPDLIDRSLQASTGTISAFDLYTRVKTGYAYGRYFLTPITQNVSISQPILQVGEFSGSFPFIIETSGTIKNVPFFKKIEVDSVQAGGDLSSKQIIAGNKMKGLEAGVQSNENIWEIVRLSLEHRMLSSYTAFLALEPSDTIFACKDCKDETILLPTFTNNDDLDTLSIAASPNPFNIETEINLSFASNVDLSKYSFAIYSMTGQLVKTFSKLNEGFKGRYKIKWEGRSDQENELPNGLYNFVMNTPKGSKSIKLVLAK